MKLKIIFLLIFLFNIISCLDKEQKKIKMKNNKIDVVLNEEKNENKNILKEEEKVKIEKKEIEKDNNNNENLVNNIVERTENGKIKYYSKILKKDLEISDILRNYYPKIIKQIDRNINLDGVDISVFKIENNALILGEKNEIRLPFDKFKRVFKANIGFPSLYNGENLNVRKRELDMTKKHIAFTFDDGPLNNNHDKIRKLFDDIDQSTTFCVVGKAFPKNKERLIIIYQNGHEIINHTTNHYNLTKLTEDKIFDEIIKTSDKILEYTGYDVELVRPPYGSFNKKVRSILNDKIALWTVDSLDWKSRNKDEIVNKVLNDTNDLDIVLFHDLYDETYEAVKYMIPIFLENGYEFTTYSEIMRLRTEKNKEM